MFASIPPCFAIQVRIFDRVLKSLMMFILIIRFHYDFIKGVDRYVTGRDAIIEDKEIVVTESPSDWNMVKLGNSFLNRNWKIVKTF